METLLSDADLVRNLRGGDVQAFDLIYMRYAARLHAFGYKYLRSQDEAEELVQSVFLKVWEKRSILEDSLSFKSFLFTIAYHDICKQFRNRKYSRELAVRLELENSAASYDTERELEYESLLERVDRLLDRLPPKQRAVFLKSRMEGKSAREIAAELGLSTGSVDNYNSATLRFLRTHLKTEGVPLLLFLSLVGRV